MERVYCLYVLHFSSHKAIATDAYKDFGKIRVRVNFLLNLGAFIVYCWLICGYQTAKSNKKVAFPVATRFL